MTHSESAASYSIVVEQLAKRHKDTDILSDINLRVSTGQCFGVLGPSNSGKSILIKSLLGLTHINDGQITVLGLTHPQNTAAIHNRCTLVTQHPSFDPVFNVAENLNLYASYFGMDKIRAQRRVKQLLDFVDLSSRATAKIESLSTLQLARLNLARALINNPDLLLLDEAVTRLNSVEQNRFWSWLKQLKKHGKTMLLTSRNHLEAELLCDEVALIDQGKIIASGAPQQLINEVVGQSTLTVHRPSKLIQDKLTEEFKQKFMRINESIYVFNPPIKKITGLMKSEQLGETHIRPANLNDVFIKLTGRNLDD